MNFRIFSILVFCTMCLGFKNISAQTSSGVISFERNSNWQKIAQELPYLSVEEKDRIQLTWGKSDGNITKMNLNFKDQQTLYTYAEDQGSTTDGSWTWRQDEFILTRDYATGLQKDLVEILGKVYLVEDSIVPVKWKILNEIKEVAGYICMKAETRDTIKNQTIHAWFTDAISVRGGPEYLGGLPGMILELNINDGAVVITATKVDLKPMPDGLGAPAKMKGKKFSQGQMNALLVDHIKTSIEGRKNPYWGIRY